MNIMTMEGVSKAFGIKQLLGNAAFGIEEGEKIGVVGKNGSGKSTFLKMAAGLDEPDQGRIVFNRDLRIEYLAQSPAYDPEATVMDSILQGSAPSMVLWRRYRDLVEQVELHPGNSDLHGQLAELNHEMDRLGAWNLESEASNLLNRLDIGEADVLMGSLSGGQRKRVALAAALMNPADLLVMDEPTNHLDNRAIDWLEKHLQKYSGALLMVTHDRYFLERVAGRIVEISQGQLYSYPGNYSVFLERKLAREGQEAATAGKRQSLLRKELDWMRQGARARTTKQKARIERFKKLQAETGKGGGSSTLQISLAASRLGKKTIILEHVVQVFGSNEIIKDYSCILDREERMGIVGPNGIGKSTLLDIIRGSLSPSGGRVETGSTVKIGYFPQESCDLPDEMRVIDYIREGGEYLQAGKGTVSASQMLETFLFTPASQWTSIGKLSGGEKRRLHLLRILMEAPNVLILDEPGNDLDIDTLGILEDYLDDFPGAVVVVSHDRFLLDRISGRILAFEGQGIIKEYPGNYTDYLELSGSSEGDRQGEAYPITPPKSGSRVRSEGGAGGRSGAGSRSEGKSARMGRAVRGAAALGTTDESHASPVIRDGLLTPDGAGRSKPLRFTYQEQKEFEQIEELIAEAEGRMAVLNNEVNRAGSDYLKLEELLEQRQIVENELDRLMERWTYLNELAEAIARQKK